MRQPFIVLLALFASLAQAKTKVDIPDFADQTKVNSCRLVAPWSRDIGFAFKQKLITALNESNHFTIVEAERLRSEEPVSIIDSGVSLIHKKRTVKVAQYSLVGQLKTFDLCPSKKGHSAKVEVEVQIIDANSGAVVRRLVGTARVEKLGREDQGYLGASFNTGLFRDSSIGKATSQAIADVTNKIKKALPNRELASNGDYKVQTFRKRPSR